MVKPFQRPSIRLGEAAGPIRTWKVVKASSLAVGDVVTSHGMVQARHIELQPGVVRLSVGAPPELRVVDFGADEKLFAFTHAEE